MKKYLQDIKISVITLVKVTAIAFYVGLGLYLGMTTGVKLDRTIELLFG